MYNHATEANGLFLFLFIFNSIHLFFSYNLGHLFYPVLCLSIIFF